MKEILEKLFEVVEFGKPCMKFFENFFSVSGY